MDTWINLVFYLSMGVLFALALDWSNTRAVRLSPRAYEGWAWDGWDWVVVVLLWPLCLVGFIICSVIVLRRVLKER